MVLIFPEALVRLTMELYHLAYEKVNLIDAPTKGHIVHYTHLNLQVEMKMRDPPYEEIDDCCYQYDDVAEEEVD